MNEHEVERVEIIPIRSGRFKGGVKVTITPDDEPAFDINLTALNAERFAKELLSAIWEAKR